MNTEKIVLSTNDTEQVEQAWQKYQMAKTNLEKLIAEKYSEDSNTAPKKKSESEFYTVKEVATKLGLRPAVIRKMAQNGRFPVVQLSRRTFRIPKKEFDTIMLDLVRQDPIMKARMKALEEVS